MYADTFPQKLRKAREDAGYTQEQIAQELNINRSSLSYYETGKQQPKLEVLAQLAQFYNVSIDWLLGVSIVPPIRPTQTKDYEPTKDHPRPVEPVTRSTRHR